MFGLGKNKKKLENGGVLGWEEKEIYVKTPILGWTEEKIC